MFMGTVTQKRPQVLLSVVICTYNRSSILPICLRALLQNTATGSWEVIVVDNNSTDSTREVFESFVAESGESTLKYVFEPKVGLSNARNRGWKEASGEYVGYLDDDGRPPRDWLTIAMDLIENTPYQVFGGPYVPFYLSEVPAWWRDAYRSGGHGEEPLELADRQFLSGGNFFIKKRLLVELGGFSPEHGMNGAKVGLGEETLLQIKLRQMYPGLSIYYDPRLRIEHLVGLKKMTMRWLVPFWFAEGRSEWRLFEKIGPDEKLRFILYRFLGTSLLALGRGLLAIVVRDRERHRYWQNYLVEELSPLVRALGRDYEIWRALRDSSR
jgi:glycosyltransferase involved in cell wall biosynthesis